MAKSVTKELQPLTVDDHMSDSKIPIYQPLDPNKKEIRILHIDHTSKDDAGRIKCHLEHISLVSEHPPSYKSISWAWGDQCKTKSILLNEKIKEIPKNAEEVLRRLCFDQGHSRIWLDAVSIDQENIVERGSQVALMREVFSMAEQVLVWLGEERNFTASAFRSIDNILVQCREELAGSPDNEISLRTFYDEDMAELSYRYSDQSLPLCDWHYLSQFYSLPWFFRLWVIQEVILGTQPICYCGSMSKTWNDISLAASWLCYKEIWRYTTEETLGIYNAGRIWTLTAMEKRTLGAYLGPAVHFEVTEPRDKVFGFMGLIQPSSGSGVFNHFKPDYRKPVEEVYTLATRAVLEERAGQQDQLQLLSLIHYLVARADGDSPAYNTPSWVPRYDWEPSYANGSCTPLTQDFTAASDCVQDQIPLSPSSSVLTVKGLIVDTVDKRGLTLSHALRHDTIRLLSQLAAMKEYIATLGGRAADFASALICGDSRKLNSRHALVKLDLFDRFKAFLVELTGYGRPLLQLAVTTGWMDPSEEFWEEAQRICKGMWRTSANRTFFTTSSGYMGMGPQQFEVGDAVCILYGSRVPFVLSPDGNRWRLRGDVWLQGVMYGEHIDMLKDQGRLELETRSFDIC